MTTAAGERIIQCGGIDLCVEAFGDPADDAVLLIHGASASMPWWEEALCARIAAGGRYVIRFDNRDTGRSSAWPPAPASVVAFTSGSCGCTRAGRRTSTKP